ncbi:DUF2767 family protein [Rahnella aquatilis]|jgi:hypothetical protein|uniref:Uncharacterized protein n=2 Tax=Rahnella TaxID=34037 RepID=H2IY06_RAHAC|nr:hypothetical protein Rahaq_3239 [Rahnella aceris]AEX53083.1 hypothetical protein Rahaq2_3276 [Rahnella aquatilis CIP 78.65 = ATCC 33071]AYA08041.1 DUF2767 family protein [Rahnella aquatilis]MCM2444694.1 DUF2767 family protein [Rahnella sp. CG8]MQB51618.1 DUF2767 family protein [Rahnella sp. RcJ3]
MEILNPVFEEACRMVGECCFMLAQNGEEISRSRIASRLERVQQSAVTITGKPNDALCQAIEGLRE